MHGIITFIAKDFIVLSILVPLVVWWQLDNTQKKHFALVLIGGAIASFVLAKIGSHFFFDTRPFIAGHFKPYFGHGNDNGFPSDHTLLAAVMAFTTWQFNKQAGIGLTIVAILIGLSRVIAGVHHLLDIIGSLIFAAIGITIVTVIIDRNNHERPRRRPEKTAAQS